MIPYGCQFIEETDISSVVDTLRSTFLTQGPVVQQFEQGICKQTHAKYCVAVSNGTAALHLAVAALSIKKGSEGITSPNTFVATSNAMIYNNIKPVFADIDENTYNISPEEIEFKINKKTKLLIPVHFAGQPCNMEEIIKIAKENELFIIEDASHAIGSKYPDKSSVGNCKYSDMTIFSFHPVKTLTTGEGGAITTNNKELYEKLLLLRTHGITKNPDLLSENPGPWYYEMQELGFNYRLTDIQSALGLSQLKRIESFKQKRRKIVKKYNKTLAKVKWITTPFEDENISSCFHLYVLQIDFEKIGKTRKEVMDQLREKEILTQVHYIPVHTQPYYKKRYNYKWGDYPVAESYYQKALSIPLYPKMTNEDVEYVVKNIKALGG